MRGPQASSPNGLHKSCFCAVREGGSKFRNYCPAPVIWIRVKGNNFKSLLMFGGKSCGPTGSGTGGGGHVGHLALHFQAIELEL